MNNKVFYTNLLFFLLITILFHALDAIAGKVTLDIIALIISFFIVWNLNQSKKR